MDLRCPSRMHGILVTEDGRACLEVKCSSKRCGSGSGRVVLHYFDLSTGEMVDTKQYNSPEHLFSAKE